MKRFLILILFVFSCGDYEEHYVDPILKPYVYDFETYIDVKVDYDVIIKDLKKHKLNAVCRHRPLKKQVIIDQQYVNRVFSHEEKFHYIWLLPIVYHELAHCSLGLHHNDELLENNKPYSWMNSKTSKILNQWTEEEIHYYKQEIKDAYENDK